MALSGRGRRWKFLVYFLCIFNTLLVFVTGRGGAGFHSQGPALTRGLEAYFSGNPRPTPARGPPALIPWTGPHLLIPIFNGDPSGVWVGRGPERGKGQGILKKTPRPGPLSGAGRGKDTPPWAVERGRAGKRAGGPGFLGPRSPRNELYTLRCIVLLSLCFSSAYPPLTLLQLRYILCCFIRLFLDNISGLNMCFPIRCSGCYGCLCISYAPFLVMRFLIIA